MTDPNLTLLDRRILKTMPEWVADIITDCARREGIRPADVILRDRSKAAVRARHEAMYLVKAMKPHLSSPRIASWFRRDHTSVLYAIAKIEALHGGVPMTKYSGARRAA